MNFCISTSVYALLNNYSSINIIFKKNHDEYNNTNISFNNLLAFNHLSIYEETFLTRSNIHFF